jgi:AcrR family transcriptional regulator
MVKPTVTPPVKSDSLADDTDTRVRIIEAAFRRLHEDGYARLSTRAIAAEAGVNHALIHYYFGTKDKLVMAALDEANRRLLDRQQRMYQSPGGFAEKWRHAREFYEQDLASGFVRVQMELFAASLSNPALRAEFVPRFLGWRAVIEAAVRDALASYRLDLPISAGAIAGWVGDFWIGMEFEMLLGIEDRVAHHTAALDLMQWLLERLDAQTSPPEHGTAEIEPPRAGELKGGGLDPTT